MTHLAFTERFTATWPANPDSWIVFEVVFQVVADSDIPEDLGGRSVGVLDYDQDGLLDLFIAEDRFAGETSVLFRNEGDIRFSDVNAAAGIPEGVHGLGVAVADFDVDGLSDIFVSGSNRLFLSDGPGQFIEAESSVFEWEFYSDDDVAGASVADVNRDGLLDLALGQHFNSTLEFGETVSVSSI
jgi:enediyne biosynthesis protein E4